MEICSILTHAVISNNKMLQSFSAKIFSALALLPSLSDITSSSKLMSVFRKVTDLFNTQARLATFLARNVKLFFSQDFFLRLPH